MRTHKRRFTKRDASENVVSSDMATALFLVFLVLYLLHSRFTSTKPEEALAKDVELPGNISVEAAWAKDLDSDVDLHVLDPRGHWVWYREQDTHFFNLVRDDRGLLYEGHLKPEEKVNIENVFARGIIAGEYTVNLHLYEDNTQVYPIATIVRVGVKKPGGKLATILEREVFLHYPKEQVTVFRFSLQPDGSIDGGISDYPIPKLHPDIP